MANEKLILHGDSDHSDTSGQAHEARNTTVVNTVTKKYGAGAFNFNGSDTCISFAHSSDWNISDSDTEDWTIDLWVRHGDHTGTDTYLSQFKDIDNYWILYHTHGSGVKFRVRSEGEDIVDTGWGSEIADASWHHIALCKVTSGDSTVEWGLYVDGEQEAYVSDSSVISFVADLYIGQNNSTNYLEGNMDEIRISQDNIFNASPESDDSDSFTSPTAAPPDYITNVIATKSTTADTIDIAWDTPNTSYATALCVERKLNNGVWNVLSSTESATATSYTDSNATQSATYYYRIRRYTSTYSNYTDYGLSNSIDTTVDTKLIAFSDKLFHGLDANKVNGSWEALPWYAEGAISIANDSNTVSGNSSCYWDTESNIAENYLLFITPSGTSSIDYSNPFTISGVDSNTALSLSANVETGCSGASYLIARNFTSGEKVDFKDYDQKCFMCKQSDYPAYYNMTSVKRMGVPIPSSACTATKAAGAGLEEGVYLYKITYTYGTYGESNGNETAATETTTAGNCKVNLTNIPIGGKDVTARNVYRTTVGGSTYYLVATISDNTTTSYADTTSDSTIVSGGTTIPSLHTEPVKLVTIEERNARLFGVDNEYQYTLRYTPTTKPYAWPTTYTVDRDGKGRIMLIVNAFEALVIFFDRGIEMADVDNATPSNWTFENIQTFYGLASRHAATRGNEGIYFLSIKDKVPGIQFLRKGEQSVVNSTFDSLVPDSISEKIDNFMKGINIDAIETCVMWFYDNKLHLSAPYGNAVTPNRTAIYDFRRDAFSIKLKGYICFTESEGDFLAGSPDDNYLHQLDYEYTWSDSTSITMRAKTGFLSGERPDLTKEFQLMRIQAEASSGTLGVGWTVKDKTNSTASGSFSFDLSTATAFEVYFPMTAVGKAIQLDFQCTNNVQTVIKGVQILFQPYELGS